MLGETTLDWHGNYGEGEHSPGCIRIQKGGFESQEIEVFRARLKGIFAVMGDRQLGNNPIQPALKNKNQKRTRVGETVWALKDHN
jgi:hypothetical protein